MTLTAYPASGDQEMLRKFLQNEWGFEGFVVSDWQSVIQLIAQGVAEDGKDAAQIAFNAGCRHGYDRRTLQCSFAQACG